jgi:acetyltransferase EpsM
MTEDMSPANVENEKAIVIIGAGGHGSEVYSYLRELVAADAGMRLLGFVDEGKPPGLYEDTRILGGFAELEALLRGSAESVIHYITAVGDNDRRRRLVEKADGLGCAHLVPFRLIHPSALCGREVEIGEGTLLAPASVVTTCVKIGRHSILNVRTSVSHDSQLGDFVNLNPGAVVCGNVRIGEGAYIGAGATLIDKVSVGEWSTIGAGAVVIDDIPAFTTAVGVPARVIKRAALGGSRSKP